MATAFHEPSEADILGQIVAPDRPTLSEPSARAILDLHFNQDAVARMTELVERNSRGTLTESERSELERYQRVGNFLNLLQAKALLSLAQSRQDG
jgi:hypothetical protein